MKDDNITGNGCESTEHENGRKFVVIRNRQGESQTTKDTRCERALIELTRAVLIYSIHLAEDHSMPVDWVPDGAALMMEKLFPESTQIPVILFDLCQERGLIL